MRPKVSIRAAVGLFSALLMLAAGGPQVGAHPPGRHRERLEAIEREIHRKEHRIEEAERERRNVVGRLEESDAEREALADRIAELGAELSAARDRLAAVEAELEIAQQAVVQWGNRLDRARERLREQEQTLETRAATAYMLGPAGYVDLLLGADDLGALSDRIVYLDNVLTIDSNLVAGLETTRSLVGDHAGLVESYESEVAEQREKVEAEVDRIAQIQAEQEAARAAVLDEIDHQESLLEEIETTKEKYEEAVAELEAQSSRIQSLLQSSGSQGSGEPSSGGDGGGGGGGGGELFWPTAGSIGSGFGWRTHPIFGTQRFHAGVDIGGACGQPIWAGEDGTVISAGYSGGYGNLTVIDHGDGLATAYAHQSSFGVSSGQSVSRGQTIGYVGTTGWSTGCHLHFEVRVNGSPVDPVPYLT